jgi:hypothetical protein
MPKKISDQRRIFIEIFAECHSQVIFPEFTYHLLAKCYFKVNGKTPFKDYNSFVSSLRYYIATGIVSDVNVPNLQSKKSVFTKNS